MDKSDEDTDVEMDIIFPSEHLVFMGWAWRYRKVRTKIILMVADMPADTMLGGIA